MTARRERRTVEEPDWGTANVVVRLLQSHRYNGPSMAGTHAAQKGKVYERDRPGTPSLIRIPRTYFEAFLEPNNWAEVVRVTETTDADGAAAEIALEELSGMKLAELRALAEQLGIDVNDYEPTGVGGRYLKADFIDIISQKLEADAEGGAGEGKDEDED